MDAAAHNPAFAKQAGVPVSVAKDFSKASKGAKFKGSGTRADSQVVNRPDTNQGKNELFSKGGDTMASKMNPGFMAMIAKKKGAGDSSMGKPFMRKGMDMAKDGAKKMASGGMPAALAKHASKPASKAHAGLKAGGMAKGGGIESKGKTKGTMIKMKSGGRAC